MSFAVRDGHWALLHVCLSHADCFWALLHVCLSYANCSWGLLHVCLSQKQKVANSSYLVHWLCKWSQHFQIEFVNWWSYSLPTWQLFDRKCHMLRTYRFKGHRQKLNRMSAYWSWLIYLRMKTFEKLQKFTYVDAFLRHVYLSIPFLDQEVKGHKAWQLKHKSGEQGDSKLVECCTLKISYVWHVWWSCVAERSKVTAAVLTYLRQATARTSLIDGRAVCRQVLVLWLIGAKVWPPTKP